MPHRKVLSDQIIRESSFRYIFTSLLKSKKFTKIQMDRGFNLDLRSLDKEIKKSMKRSDPRTSSWKCWSPCVRMWGSFQHLFSHLISLKKFQKNHQKYIIKFETLLQKIISILKHLIRRRTLQTMERCDTSACTCERPFSFSIFLHLKNSRKNLSHALRCELEDEGWYGLPHIS